MIVKKLILTNTLSILGLLLICSSAFGMDIKIAQDQAKIAVVDRKVAQESKADKEAKKAAQELAIQKVEKAIDSKDLQGVQAYIATGASVNARDSCGWKLLYRAVYCDNLDAAQLLAKHGAGTANEASRKTDETEVCCNTPLHCAVIQKNLRMINFLLDNGANIEARTDYQFYTPLMTAVENACDALRKEQTEWLKVIELLINRGANIEAKAVFNLTPLLKTMCTHGRYNDTDWKYGICRRLPIIKALVRWGADYETHRQEFNTFLAERKKYAEEHKEDMELEAIATLKKHLEEFPTGYQNESTAACLTHLNIDQNESTQSELKSVMEEFIQGPASVDGMMKAKIKDHIRNNDTYRLIELFGLTSNGCISNKNYLELPDETGYTPLLYAVYLGNPQSVKALLDKGSHLDAKTKHGQTAHMIADQQFQATGNEVFRTIKTLLDDCAISRIQAEQARIKGEEERLKKEEADAFVQLAQLQQAISDNNQDIVRDCLNLHIVNKKYADGSLPLIHAAGLGRTAIVTQLIEQGAQLNVRDDNYHTALTKAVINGHVEMIAILLKHMSSDQISLTVHGKTAYDFAKESAARIKKLLGENPLPEYAQQQKKYEQIMMLLDSYNNVSC